MNTKRNPQSSRTNRQDPASFLHGDYTVWLNGKSTGPITCHRDAETTAGGLVDLAIELTLPPGPKRRNVTVKLVKA